MTGPYFLANDFRCNHTERRFEVDFSTSINRPLYIMVRGEQENAWFARYGIWHAFRTPRCVCVSDTRWRGEWFIIIL